MPDWIAKTLAILDALSGWVLLALTIALGIVLFAPTPLGIDLQPIRRDWGGWIFVGLVVFGFLTLARFAQWAAATVRSALQRQRERVEEEERRRQAHEREQAEVAREQEERAQYKSRVLAHLDTLSSEERDALKYLVEHNQRTDVGPLHFGVLHTLHTKGLLEVQAGILTPMRAPHTVPDFVWNALLVRRDELFGADTGRRRR